MVLCIKLIKMNFIISDQIQRIADYEGRSVNRHVLVLIRENIKAFEEENGAIEGNINSDVNVKPTRK